MLKYLQQKEEHLNEQEKIMLKQLNNQQKSAEKLQLLPQRGNSSSMLSIEHSQFPDISSQGFNNDSQQLKCEDYVSPFPNQADLGK